MTFRSSTGSLEVLIHDEWSTRRQKEISVLFQLKEALVPHFKTLAIHHLRKNFSVPDLKLQLNDIFPQPAIKPAVTFLTKYGPRIWPANHKFQCHLPRADLAFWGSKRSTDAPVYAQDASLTAQARAKFRKRNGDRDLGDDLGIAISKMGKLMSEFYGALLYVLEDEGREGQMDGDELLNAVLGKNFEGEVRRRDENNIYQFQAHPVQAAPRKKRPSASSSNQGLAKRRLPSVQPGLPPPVWTPITSVSTWRPTPEMNGDSEGMNERLRQYRISTGGLGGLPRS